MAKTGPKPKTIAERFWPKVDKRGTDDCWPFKCLSPFGYGRLSRGGRKASMAPAHRISYELHYGPIPDDMVVMHTCDNRACVNPKHLVAGTQAENMADMREKGRAAPFYPSMPGASHPLATITPEIAQEVLRLRNEGCSQNEIARKLGISKGSVFNVYSGKHWTVVTNS